jgi:hypothetical protein
VKILLFSLEFGIIYVLENQWIGCMELWTMVTMAVHQPIMDWWPFPAVELSARATPVTGARCGGSEREKRPGLFLLSGEAEGPVQSGDDVERQWTAAFDGGVF